MKKQNVFLAIICALAMGIYIFFVEFQFGSSAGFSDVNLLLQALAQWGLVIVLFLCFALENSLAMLVAITGGGVLGAFGYPESIFTVFPLLMHIWFIKLLKQKENRILFFISYFISLLVAIILGVILVANMQKAGFSSTPLSIVFAVVLVLLCVLFAVLFFKSGQPVQKAKGKKGSKKSGKQFNLETNAVLFFFFEAFVLVLSVIYFVKTDWNNNQFTVGFLCLCVALTVYTVGSVVLMVSGKDSTKLIAPFKSLFD